MEEAALDCILETLMTFANGIYLNVLFQGPGKDGVSYQSRENKVLTPSSTHCIC